LYRRVGRSLRANPTSLGSRWRPLAVPGGLLTRLMGAGL
jgi:hypothetical protein